MTGACWFDGGDYHPIRHDMSGITAKAELKISTGPQ